MRLIYSCGLLGRSPQDGALSVTMAIRLLLQLEFASGHGGCSRDKYSWLDSLMHIKARLAPLLLFFTAAGSLVAFFVGQMIRVVISSTKRMNCLWFVDPVRSMHIETMAATVTALTLSVL